MDKSDIYNDLRQLILSKEFSSQNDICDTLERLGYSASQSKVNRMLKKIGAVKVKNEKSTLVYKIPNEPAPPIMTDNISSLVIKIDANEAIVIIDTAPGAAQLVARTLDYNKNSFEIIGIVAGDDTIFVAPSSIKNIKKLKTNIENFLFSKI
ncbi:MULTISPECIES: arginine repressor [Francisella]|uniref:Arginine repressor n=3 Tax=Francisella TaxID=262 RepID=A0AAJ4NP76_9GAMM|nr:MULTISPECIES: arginine repressor ArgR [Francisella]AEI35194.1 Arginine pathway regulatory protein ArgR, repressor of arg regulon [Francisella salina]QEO58124.1 ArgR family transcriptional regulator [Francisella marina]QEO59648.1 ArgR family transcriptional regulator [Francisella marina]QWU99550.1 ArgR family transcriptional regulator [Francisella salimarina]